MKRILMVMTLITLTTAAFVLLISIGSFFQEKNGQSGGGEFEKKRLEMVARQVAKRGVKDERVLEAMRSVPRHLFVPEELRGQAYGDYPLPIGNSQTISQPYIVALMTELLALKGDEKVLEVGTGSGYQAAVLSLLAGTVFSIEVIPGLAADAKERLHNLGYRNVEVIVADGWKGLPLQGPFDAIIVTAAADSVPGALERQLGEGGRMVIPVGPQGGVQELLLLTRKGDRIERKNITAVRFVPLVREESGP